MGTVPVLKPREVVALRDATGFQRNAPARISQTVQACRRCSTTVPFHKGRDISPTLLRQIAKDLGLSTEHLLAGKEQR